MEISKPLIFLSAADERFPPLTSKNRQRDNAFTLDDLARKLAFGAGRLRPGPAARPMNAD